MSYLPELNVDVPCDPADLITSLEEELEKSLGDFSNVLKNSKIWGNPLITSAITQIIGTAATFATDSLFNTLIESDLVSEVLERAQDYISILMTSQAQMKLAVYYLLVQSLKNDLEKRKEVLQTIHEKLRNMEKFIRAWDYYEVAGRELNKLRNAERSMKSAAANMKRAKQVFETFQRFASSSYNSSVDNVGAAARSLETRYVDPFNADIQVYWQKWWDKVQEDLMQFAQDSIDILNLLPVNQKILNDVFPEWVSIYGLLYLKFAKDATQTGIDWKWVAEQIQKIFKPNKLIPLNTVARKSVNEIKDIDSTWEGMKKFASQLAGDLEESYENIRTIQQEMEHDAYIDIPSDVKLAAKNAIYLVQVRTLETKLMMSQRIVNEYDDILDDFAALEALISECREYPEEGEHPAETIPDLIFKNYESIIFGFFSEGGSRKSLIQMGNIRRRIGVALGKDSYLINLCNSFNVLDNALIEEALKIYNDNIGSAQDLLNQLGQSSAVNALVELDFTGFVDTLWPKREENRCAGKEAVGELAENKAEMELKQNQRKINWTESLIDRMDFIKDPKAAMKDSLGLEMLGE